MNVDHYLRGGLDVYAIKLADAIHNCKSIKEYDKGFFYKYLEEKRLLISQISTRVENGKCLNTSIIRKLIDYFDECYSE